MKINRKVESLRASAIKNYKKGAKNGKFMKRAALVHLSAFSNVCIHMHTDVSECMYM